MTLEDADVDRRQVGSPQPSISARQLIANAVREHSARQSMVKPSSATAGLPFFRQTVLEISIEGARDYFGAVGRIPILSRNSSGFVHEASRCSAASSKCLLRCRGSSLDRRRCFHLVVHGRTSSCGSARSLMRFRHTVKLTAGIGSGSCLAVVVLSIGIRIDSQEGIRCAAARRLSRGWFRECRR